MQRRHFLAASASAALACPARAAQPDIGGVLRFIPEHDLPSPDPLADDSPVTRDADYSGGTALRMIVRHTAPAVRPDDVLAALREVSDLTPAAPPLMTRLAQGSLGESGVVQP